MKKYKKKQLGFASLMLLGAGFALAAIIVLSLILAVISSLMGDPLALCGAFSLLALILAGAVSGFITSRVNGDGGVPVSALSSVIAAAVILLIGLVWMRGSVNLGVILNLMSFVGVSVIAALLGRRRAGKSRRKYR